MTRTLIRRGSFLTLTLLAGAIWVGCSDDKECQPYVREVVDGARRGKNESAQAFAQRLGDHQRAVGSKYRDRLKQCRGKVRSALQKELISHCMGAPSAKGARSPWCPEGWDPKQCCQLSAFCILRHPTAADYCQWEPPATPAPALPRCTNCPGCVREGTTPPPKQLLDLWLGGDGETLAVVADKPVSDVWLLPENAPVAHLEPLLYALWKLPSYFAPKVAIVRGEIVSVDGWNTLEQALQLGGWGNMDLNLAQWQGHFRCAPLPPAQSHSVGPGRHTVTVSITASEVRVNGKPLLELDKDMAPPDAMPNSFTMPSLQRRLQSIQRPASRPGVLIIAIRRGLKVPARLVAKIIFTGTQALSGAHARITCVIEKEP